MADADLLLAPLSELRRSVSSGELSARELLQLSLARIEALNPGVNAVITLDTDRAHAAAAAADEATAAGRSHGPLHGIPITVKDALAVEGVRSTGGATELAEHVPTSDADVVAAVRAAGAIPFAKTNVPRWSGDLQTYNDLFGTTNNPWDLTRVPGGSSGGAATAVALGFSPFELGTDIGGSIRIPAAFCGIVGHKPSFGLVPCGGYLDRVDYGLTEPDINVHGPLARSVDDLEFLLDLIAGPRPDRVHALRHVLPPPRHRRIDEFRIALWSDVDAVPSSQATRGAVEQAGAVLETVGARMDRAARPALDPVAASRLGSWLVVAAMAPALSADESAFFQQLAAADGLPEDIAFTVSAYTASHADWMAKDIERARIRALWREFFGDVDALVCPVTIAPAFPHTQAGTAADRTVKVDGVARPYLDFVFWTILVGMAYLPATVVPVGFDDDGMPLAVQIVGPYLEDRTALAVARALRTELGPLTFPEAAWRTA